MSNRQQRRSQGKKGPRQDVPYIQRMQEQKHAVITAERDDAANVALRIAMVALNDLEGMGYLRLCRFAKHTLELIREFYKDRELNEDRLQRRLTQMGFVFQDGSIYCVEDLEGNTIKMPKGVKPEDG